MPPLKLLELKLYVSSLRLELVPILIAPSLILFGLVSVFSSLWRTLGGLEYFLRFESLKRF